MALIQGAAPLAPGYGHDMGLSTTPLTPNILIKGKHKKQRSMAKGLDGKFLHYGIRREDLELIRTLCEKHDIDFDWLSEEILRKYHAAKVDKMEMGDDDTERIVADAIAQLK